MSKRTARRRGLHSARAPSAKSISPFAPGSHHTISRNSTRWQEVTESGKEWQMRWFFLILMALWILAGMILPIVAFCLTKNPLSLSLFGSLAPPLYILYRMVRYLFPRDDRDYEIEAIRVLCGVETQQHSKGQAALEFLRKNNLLPGGK